MELRNYLKNHKRAWYTVGYFTTEPKDWPSRSKELVEIAKFKHEGDAWQYAMSLAANPGTLADAWALVIR